MLATLAAASALLLAPIPPQDAFQLPDVKQCVRGGGTLTVKMRRLAGEAAWRSATVKINGKRVLRVTQPRPTRAIRVRDLPSTKFKLTVDARTDDGRSATVSRNYHPCPAGGRPTVTFPAGAPPTTLIKRDLIKGTGVRVRPGQIMRVHYVMAAWSTRKVVDSSWSRGEPFDFEFGSGQVIRGWDEGLKGMRVGGRRELVMPPRYAYGEDGVPPAIKSDETLVSVVDLIAVRD